MFFLAQCLESGTGTVADPLEAATWYKKAADLGNRKAIDWCRQNGRDL
jgi:TPR repeat protein